MSKLVARSGFVAAIFLLCAGIARAGTAPVQYFLSLADSSHHLLHVRVVLPAGPADREIQLPVWNALYQIRDFSQNLRNLRAMDQNNRALRIHALDKSRWKVDGAGNGVELDYETYSDQSGPYGAEVNREHAFLNLAEVLVYATDARSAPTTLTVTDMPHGWKIATALPESGHAYSASDYDHLVDAPLELGMFRETSFQSGGATYRLAIDADAGSYNIDSLRNQVRKIVATGAEWMQDRPYDSYLFIYHFPQGRGGGGMEHAYSCAIDLDAERLSAEPLSFERITAHEFFHLWNVKRIRPASLEPLDYTRENYTRALWFSEGVTSAVADIWLLRSGLLTTQRFEEDLAAEISTLQMRPAHLTQSVEESSLDTWLDKYPNYRMPARSISYYNKGEILGVLLDLEVREATHGQKSLRDVFIWMNQHYAQQHRFFEDSDGVRAAVEAVTGKSFADFFSRYVTGVEELPYNRELATIGLQLVEQKMQLPVLGFDAVRNFDAAPVVVAVDDASDAAREGIAVGDRILQLNGHSASQDIEKMVYGLHAGDVVRLKVAQKAGTREVRVKLGGREEERVAIVERPNATAEQRAARAAWLAGKAEN